MWGRREKYKNGHDDHKNALRCARELKKERKKEAAKLRFQMKEAQRRGNKYDGMEKKRKRENGTDE